MGIYLHIPFCKQACHYCDFHFSTNVSLVNEMVEAIHTELILRKDYLKGEKVETIYFGGGTPSLLNEVQLKYLLDTIHHEYSLSENPEITLEANPDDLSQEKLQAFLKAGVNRLSIGIQSFDEADLRYMNRAHNAGQALNAVKDAQAAGFDNITIDLIYGSPPLTDEQWKKNLEIAFDLGIDHISSYALTVEPKTALATMIRQKKTPDVDDVKSSRHFEMLMDMTAANGFEHYEISNFARNKKYSRHNTSYWQRKAYLGVGPSAHSYDGKSRQWNVYNNQVYLRSLKTNVIPYEKEELTKKDQYNEFIMTGLRTIWGVKRSEVREEFGPLIYEHFNAKVELLLIEKNIIESEDRITLTRKGKFFADRIASELFFI